MCVEHGPIWIVQKRALVNFHTAKCQLISYPNLTILKLALDLSLEEDIVFK